eukprot:TRINITY_DN1983_c1_g2_i1.p1 TRINITY_DN1983_c1_g2~~TRINITY_DN1983_c1_g2_i1.p1  ORF type:complete len:213 (+),score=47.57 TRINITY_DN1983_c1_g2_i1:505-1143(+)
MESVEKTPFAWGGTAVSLLRTSRKADLNGDRLPGYAADEIREIRDETKTQVEKSMNMRENPHVDMSKEGGFYPAHTIACEAALRNKRVLHCYENMRRIAMCDAYWQVGQNLPQHTMTSLSPGESNFYRAYSSLCSAYMESQNLNLRSNLYHPPQVTDMVYVRGLKECTYVSAETLEEIKIKKGKFFVVTQEEATILMQQGSVEPVIEGCVKN